MENYTFGRKQKKIQWRTNLPIVLSILGVVGLVCGVVNLVVAQVKPEEEQISTITITKNTPSASELNLNAPLVDYHPNKDQCQEEKLNDEETDEARDKRLAECKEKKEKEEKEKKEAESAEKEKTEVLGESEEKASLMEILAKTIGASAAKSNEAKTNASTTTTVDKSKEKESTTGAGGSTDSAQDEVDDSVGKNTDN